jgi:hypothetical protein
MLFSISFRSRNKICEIHRLWYSTSEIRKNNTPNIRHIDPDKTIVSFSLYRITGISNLCVLYSLSETSLILVAQTILVTKYHISLSLTSKHTIFFRMIHPWVEGTKKLDWETNQHVELDWLKLQVVHLWSSFVYLFTLAKRRSFWPLSRFQADVFLTFDLPQTNKLTFFSFDPPFNRGNNNQTSVRLNHYNRYSETWKWLFCSYLFLLCQYREGFSINNLK